MRGSLCGKACAEVVGRWRQHEYIGKVSTQNIGRSSNGGVSCQAFSSTLNSAYKAHSAYP